VGRNFFMIKILKIKRNNLNIFPRSLERNFLEKLKKNSLLKGLKN